MRIPTNPDALPADYVRGNRFNILKRKQEKMAATMKDIASQTGLGLATISRYLNGGKVKEQNRIAIETAISELSFTVNEFARSLKTSKSRTIGVIIPELNNTFVATIITVIEDILRKKGYAVIICDCSTNEDLEKEAVQFLMNKTVDGIINMPVCKDGSHLKPALDKDLPVVLIDRMIAGLSGCVDAVVVDNMQAAKDAAGYLIANGHRKIGIIVGPEDIYTSKQRLLGYNLAFAGKGLASDIDYVEYGDYTVHSGYENMQKLLSKHSDMTAVFVTNYEMTLGAIIAINEAGIKLPDELSIIGFDNLQLAQVIKPRLTIITQPLEEIGEQAAAVMLKRLSGNTAIEAGVYEVSENAGSGANADIRSSGRTITLSTRLQLGESVMQRS